MGAAHVPHALGPHALGPHSVRSRASSFAAAVLLLLGGTAGAALGQSPLTRDFEPAFFAERLLRVERAYRAAPEARRRAADPYLVQQRRAAGLGSAAAERARALAAAFAVLHGRSPDDAATRSRFELRLHALPEVVDPELTAGDRERLLALLGLRVHPEHRREPEDRLEDAGRIHLTAQAAFGAPAAADAQPEFTVHGAGGRAELARRACESPEDPSAWLLPELSVVFDADAWAPQGPMAPPWRSFVATLELSVAGELPGPAGLRNEGTFHVAPRFTRAALHYFEQRQALLAALAPPPLLRDSLELRTQELLRVFAGHGDPFASWPCRALHEGRMLLDRVRKGLPLAPPGRSGEERLGLRLPDHPEVQALRVLWQRDEEGRIPRATVVVAPPSFGVDWASSPRGLAQPGEALLGEGPGLVLFVTPLALPAVATVLEERYGVRPGATTLVGILEAGIAARVAAATWPDTLERVTLVGAEIVTDELLRAGAARAYRVLAVHGAPTAERLAAQDYVRARVGEAWPKGGIAIDPGPSRALTEALHDALGH